jgi:hypothetical protein
MAVNLPVNGLVIGMGVSGAVEAWMKPRLVNLRMERGVGCGHTVTPYI